MKTYEEEIIRGSYKKLSFEICKPVEPYNWYRYYIYLVLPRIQDEELAENLWLEAKDSTIVLERPRKMYMYYDNDFLINVPMHGEITFYKKEFNQEDERVIKIGCDYNHYFDEYRGYILEDVKEEVKETIDYILNKVDYQLPSYLHRIEEDYEESVEEDE